MMYFVKCKEVTVEEYIPSLHTMSIDDFSVGVERGHVGKATDAAVSNAKVTLRL